MPVLLFTDDKSDEYRDAVELGNRLSETDGFQLLAEVDQSGTAEQKAAEAAQKITVGPGKRPDFDEVYDLDQLQGRHAWARIYAQTEDGGRWFEGEAANSTAFDRRANVFEVIIRWQIRDVEMNQYGYDGCYNAFWNILGFLPDQLRAAAKAANFCPRIRIVQRGGLGYPDRQTKPAQGWFLTADLAVAVGDIEQ